MATAAKKRRVWPWVLVGVAVLMFGGCTAIVVAVGVGVDEAVDELNEEQERHAISQEQFDAIAIGTARQQVIDTLGKEPEDTQEFVTEGVVDETEIQSSCIYYNREGGDFGDIFQFCFDGDTLRSKNSF